MRGSRRAISMLFLELAFFLSLARGLAADSSVRWASSGGGWRSMVSNFGYIHAFQKAGLIDTTGSVFTAASFNSGASWFAAQLFYSQPFFDRLIGEDIDEGDVYDFSIEWLDSYGDYLDGTGSLVCSPFSGFAFINFFALLSDACNTVLRGSWYAFIREMLEYSATNIYGDTGFADREMVSENRVSALRDTHLMFQMGLSETSRYGTILKRRSYVSTAGSERTLAVPVPVQYAVTDSSVSFRYGLAPDQVDPSEILITTHERAPSWFDFSDWDQWYRFTGAETSGDIYSQKPVDVSTIQVFAPPFNNGKATVAQIAASSSSNLSSWSGSVPSFLFHHYSVALNDAENAMSRFLVHLEVGLEYLFPGFFDNAVCTKTPNECGAADGRFIDGGFIDGPSLAQNIGHHHSVENGDLSKKLKVILTNNNSKFDTNVKLLSYFSTDFNQDINPGDFIWAPFTVPDYRSRQETPWRSPQIFSEPMDDATLLRAFVPIDGTTLTTAEYTVTTVDNPAFGVQQGQTVEILLLQINTQVEVNFLFQSYLAADKEELAHIARTIAGSAELVRRIGAFLEK